jgi:glutamine---fructose-6-phosphate transaminase (isomerizing)
MCGIIGYVGSSNCYNVLLDGLSRLEYRGYDSAGITINTGKNLETIKSVGQLKFLKKIVEEKPLNGFVGIGHTRWATHGEPSHVNSHPQNNASNTISVVHNGIIENYLSVKEELISHGYTFHSETDTETIVNLIDFYYKGGLSFEDSVFEISHRLNGAYALGIITSEIPDTIFAVKKDCPLIIGIGNGQNYIASDVSAILEYTKDVYLLEDNEIAIVKKDSIEMYDQNKELINRDVFKVDWDFEAAEKGGFDHFMLKEIYEQPKVIKDTMFSRLKDDHVELDKIKLSKAELEKIDKIYIVACGTAYNAGLIGKSLMESKLRIPVTSEVASEFRYKNPILDENTLVIIISQSGETADSLAALKLAKLHSARVLGVVNCVGSSIARYSDDVFYTLAGPEIAVASTKAFSAQLIAMYLITIHIGMELGKISVDEYKQMKDYMYELPSLIDIILSKASYIEGLAKEYLNFKNVFLVGRGTDYLIATEGCLKIKEIAYMHSEAFPAGELKHGTIALIENTTLLIGIVTQESLFEKTVSNIKECKSRGCKVLAIAMEGMTEISHHADHVFFIPRTDEMFAPLLANISQQLFAYYLSYLLGNDVDKPRNLAKSVTVE